MKKIAFIFPGQGSQASGMGLDLYNNFEVSKNIYDNIGKDRASKEETPGKKKLNMFFKCLQIPYTIESKMISDKSKRITVWYIVRA